MRAETQFPRLADATSQRADVTIAGVVLVVLLSAMAHITLAQVPSPTLEGPVSGGKGVPFLATTSLDLSQVGYSQTEYFISGTATAYTSTAPLTSDGKWAVAPGSTAAYKTRILVYQPIKPSKFKGTVIVEWLNVSGGLDSGVDWINAHVEMIREGMAWVGVSAQFGGVENPVNIPTGNVGLLTAGIKAWDPERYGSLSHPGDSFSYDIFSQVAQAVRHPAGISPISDPKKIKKLIASGESQSASRMVTYVNAVDPVTQIFDGYFIHSRGGAGAALSQSPQPAIAAPSPTFTRSDVRVPVLTFETETDLILFGYFPARQDDSDKFRLWEMAGAAHVDLYTLVVGPKDVGTDPAAADLVVMSSVIQDAFGVSVTLTCNQPINSAPQHFVLDAAFAALNKWVTKGTLPPQAPRMDVVAGPPVALARDANGNARGGIRTPEVDVPIAAFSGMGNAGVFSFCIAFGTTAPFDAATLSALYPTHSAYTKAFNTAANSAKKAGFILAPDATLMKKSAKASGIGT
jgi:hypothetical protein